MSVGNFLGGLAQGFGRGRVVAQEQERQKKMADLQGKLVTLQLEDAQRKAAARESIAGALRGPPAAVSVGDGDIAGDVASAQPAKPDLLTMLGDRSVMANLIEAGFDPTKIAALQQNATAAKQSNDMLSRFFPGGAGAPGQGGAGAAGGGGVGAPGPGGGASQFGPPSLTFQPGQPLRVTFNPRKVRYQDTGSMLVAVDEQGNPVPGANLPKSMKLFTETVENADGSKHFIVRPEFYEQLPKFLAAGGGSLPVLAGTGPSAAARLLESPLTIDDSNRLRLPDGSRPPPGMSLGDALAAGASPETTGEQNVELSQRGAKAVLSRMTELLKVFPETDNPASRVVEAGKLAVGVATQGNQDAVLYQSLSMGSLASIIRALGERGSLAEGDVTRAMNLIPKLFPVPDKRSVAKDKLKQLGDILNAVEGKPAAPQAGASSPRIPDPPPGFQVVR